MNDGPELKAPRLTSTQYAREAKAKGPAKLRDSVGLCVLRSLAAAGKADPQLAACDLRMHAQVDEAMAWEQPQRQRSLPCDFKATPSSIVGKVTTVLRLLQAEGEQDADFSATILRCHNRATGANATDVREVAALSPMYQILQGILTELAVPDSGALKALLDEHKGRIGKEADEPDVHAAALCDVCGADASLLHARVAGRRRCVAQACRESTDGVTDFTLHSNASAPNSVAVNVTWLCEIMPSVVALDATGPEWRSCPEPKISETRFDIGAHSTSHSNEYYASRVPAARNTEAWRTQFEQQDTQYTKYNPPWICRPEDTSACKLLRFLGFLVDTSPKGGLERGSVPACGVNPPDVATTALCLVSCRDETVLESTPVHIDSCDARNGCLAQSVCVPSASPGLRRTRGKGQAVGAKQPDTGGNEVLAVWMFASLSRAVDMRSRLLQLVAGQKADPATMVADASAHQLRQCYAAWQKEEGGDLQGVWLIEQRAGDIVDVPAGLQHAVGNAAKCSKVAVEGGGLQSCAFAAAGRNLTRRLCAAAQAQGGADLKACPKGAVPIVPTEDYCSVSNMLLTWVEAAGTIISEERRNCI